MINPQDVLEVALLILGAFLVGAVTGAVLRLITGRRARAARRAAEAAGLSTRPQDRARLRTSRGVLAAANDPAIPRLDLVSSTGPDKSGVAANDTGAKAAVTEAPVEPVPSIAPARKAGETVSAGAVAFPRVVAPAADAASPEVSPSEVPPSDAAQPESPANTVLMAAPPVSPAAEVGPVMAEMPASADTAPVSAEAGEPEPAAIASADGAAPAETAAPVGPAELLTPQIVTAQTVTAHFVMAPASNVIPFPRSEPAPVEREPEPTPAISAAAPASDPLEEVREALVTLTAGSVAEPDEPAPHPVAPEAPEAPAADAPVPSVALPVDAVAPVAPVAVIAADAALTPAITPEEPVAVAPVTSVPDLPAADAELAAMRAIEGNWTAPDLPPPPEAAPESFTSAAAEPEVMAVAVATIEAVALPAEAAPTADIVVAEEMAAEDTVAEEIVAAETGVDVHPGYAPPVLAAPRGEPDPLVYVVGILPEIEKKLNALGLFHFDQIAALTNDNVAWVESQLGISDRIVPELWREQARELAAMTRSRRA